MNRLPPLIFGVFLTFAAAWLGVVAYSYIELGRMEPVLDEASGEINPPPISGLAAAGQRVYAANGCVACHTQQVRPASLSSDLAKKLGPRPTVARDFLREHPAFLGSLRIGPDLTNAGLLTKPDGAPVDANWFHRHLYEPTTVTPGSNMPSFRYLYRLRKIVGQPSALAVQGLTGPHAPAPGYEVVPSEDARTLVAYLLSLKRNYPLPEAEPLQ
ncbi:MAG TPA: cbb3-type cytochrome c oxidase subunit II [Terrimicrobiaceae bacterium]|nr:cbb3-type cytochrome c oxidase subunit II [Terrimicrobiaceae bacterium]